MSWVQGYRAALARTFVREGYPHQKSWSPYGSPEDYQKSYEMTEHLKTDTGWTIEGDPTETEWSEFAGTFAPTGAGQRHAIGAKVSCSCGEFQGVEVFIQDTSFSDLLLALLRDEG